MRKQIVRILAALLAVVAVLLIHKRIQREAEELASPAVEAVSVGEKATTGDTQVISVLRTGDGVVLGQIRENTEHGGVDITVPAQDGGETVYTFRDVSADAWYADAVNFAVSAGLMTGIGGEPAFRPEYGIQREIFASILYRFANGEPPEAEARFEDVSEDKWYYDAVAWVTEEGLMTAVDAGVFGVGKYMTCEQSIVGLYRLAGEPEASGDLTDYPYAAKVSEYGRGAVDWAWKNGLITEDECVWYPPQAISRAQVALLLMRFSEKIS